MRRKGEWTDGKRAKGKSNVSGMAEGMKVTYWGVDQSGCVLRLDMRYCQKKKPYLSPQNICVSRCASHIAALINSGRLEMSWGGGNFSLQRRDVSPKPYKTLRPASYPFWRLFLIANRETIYTCAEHNIFNERNLYTSEIKCGWIETVTFQLNIYLFLFYFWFI